MYLNDKTKETISRDVQPEGEDLFYIQYLPPPDLMSACLIAFWVRTSGRLQGRAAECGLWGIHMEVSQGLIVIVRHSCVTPSHSEPVGGSEKRKPPF